jgi:hypothetical protein
LENSINNIEPRINIRQQVSKQFALKLENLKNQTTTQIIDFEDDFLGVEKKTLGACQQ